jgi:hypothetical protein
MLEYIFAPYHACPSREMTILVLSREALVVNIYQMKQAGSGKYFPYDMTLHIREATLHPVMIKR